VHEPGSRSGANGELCGVAEAFVFHVPNADWLVSRARRLWPKGPATTTR
jgi:hypothetical protein